MILLPGCSCCAGATPPCEDCQAQCGYQMTVDREETADDLTAWYEEWWPVNYPGQPPITFGKTIAGPTACAEVFNLDVAQFFTDTDTPSAGDGANYIVVAAGYSAINYPVAGRAQSLTTSTPVYGGTRGPAWITHSYPFEWGDDSSTTAYREDRFILEWAIQCENFVVAVVDGQPVTQLSMVLRATLDQYIEVNGNPTANPLLDPFPPGSVPYDPPYVFDGTYENEWPYINTLRQRTMAHVLASACQSPDAITESCRGDDGPVVSWRPTYLKVEASEDGIAITTPGGVTQYAWQTDDFLIDDAEWREYELDTGTGIYEQVFKRAPNGEPYFDPLPMETFTWEANFLSTSGDVTVTFDDWCDLSYPAGEDTIEVPEGTPLPLGEEQAAYVHGYATEQTAETDCPLVSYPSWSVYWKNKHLLITDLAVARCGDIPSVTTFTVWLYFDGLLNNQLEGNEIGGVPVNGFVMAVRSWNVTVRLGQDPVITQDTSTSPCSAEGEMPFCDDLVPEFTITYGEP